MNSADSEEAKRNPPFEGNSFLQQQSVCWWESKEDDRADLSGTNTPIGLKWLRANKDALDAREKRTTEAIEKARVEAEQIRKEKYIKIRRQGIKLREKMQKMNIRQNAEHVGAPNVKFVGTQTRDTQRSTVQSQLKKEELRPSLNDVDPNRTSRISSHVAESECRLTRRGVESLKKACLVLERELAGICRSPDPGSEQGEESQVSQVRAEIFHLQKKLLDLSNAQKQRAAVLDRVVRLVDQMSRIHDYYAACRGGTLCLYTYTTEGQENVLCGGSDDEDDDDDVAAAAAAAAAADDDDDDDDDDDGRQCLRLKAILFSYINFFYQKGKCRQAEEIIRTFQTKYSGEVPLPRISSLFIR
ncbi:unnamed protein product [Schistocephalus solidus]|uniref:Uncharacterized protein n=1 Tax=Schistocephalus solidus TaxID=70667 RepID=A0A183T3D1_SCHSO|nr:unnamed protein product [Schistocephalus solidus]